MDCSLLPQALGTIWVTSETAVVVTGILLGTLLLIPIMGVLALWRDIKWRFQHRLRRKEALQLALSLLGMLVLVICAYFFGAFRHAQWDNYVVGVISPAQYNCFYSFDDMLVGIGVVALALILLPLYLIKTDDEKKSEEPNQ